MDDTDRLLLKQIAEGTEDALERLYRHYGLRLLNFLLQHSSDREAAEEALQATMLAVWKGAKDFRGESKVSTWLFSIARNQALKVHHPDQTHRPLYENMAASSDEVADPIVAQAMQAALAKLPTAEQEALELVYYRGLTLSEAAAHLNIPLNTLKSRLHHARLTLRKALAKEGMNHASGI